MNELKSMHAFNVYEAYTKTGDDDATQVYLKSEVDAAIKKLKRALWLTRARTAYLEFRLFVKDSVHTADNTEADHAERMAMKWHNVEHKCQAKAEEYR